MQIEYRIAVPEDLAELCALVQKAIETMIEHHIDQWDERYPDEDILREDIQKGQLYVGIVENQIAVMYVLNQECDEEYAAGQWKYADQPYYVIHRLCVNPAFQNCGVGRETMRHIEKEGLAAGVSVIRLDAFTENPFALRLYESLGYVGVGYVHWRKGKFRLMEKEI